MKKIIFPFLMAALLFGAGCMIYIDKPAVRTISGQVVSEQGGEPVPFAVLWFYSERSKIGMATNHGIDATAYADKEGKFTIKARLNEKVTVLVYKEGKYQSYELPAFPASNEIAGIVWRFGGAGDAK
ncbi:MAG: carboxypeptidase-like regulatory domain-containing protein [Opitutaceae bacterium]|jgi:hypothetical protein|nr:carboxypeptidase-like regulatory domain-containing protein [Opitutaceae bacterium]